MKAPINKIIPFSNVDGPGNRTAIFFQSCPFNCYFCHNPETINLCINCGDCVLTCPVNALSVVDGKVVWDKDKCVDCDTCIKTCKHLSSPKINYYSVDQVVEIIKKSKTYIRGITVSGGECTNFRDFLVELFKEVKKLGLTCLIDSNGNYDFESDPELTSLCDGVMLDVKAYDKEFHFEMCNYDNETVLKNLEYLLSVNKLEEVRTVLFPKFEKENEKTVEYVSSIIKDKSRYKLIKYRPFGVREEGLKFCGDEITSDDILEECRKITEKYGVNTVLV